MIFEHEGHRYPSKLQPGALGKVSGSLNFREACNSAELKKNKMKSLCFIPAMNNNSSLEWSWWSESVSDYNQHNLHGSSSPGTCMRVFEAIGHWSKWKKYSPSPGSLNSNSRKNHESKIWLFYKYVRTNFSFLRWVRLKMTYEANKVAFTGCHFCPKVTTEIPFNRWILLFDFKFF